MFKNFIAYLVVLIAISLVSVVAYAAEVKHENKDFKFYKIDDSYENVRVDLDYAITGRGIKVNGVSHISDMLVRTGKDIGRTNKIFAHAEANQFCSATLSRNMTEADPLNIVFCPYIIYIYSLPTEKDIVYIGYRKLPPLDSTTSKKAVAAVVKTYEEIITNA